MPNSTRPFLECFYALADLDEAIRSSATKDLVAHLAKGEVDEEDMGAGSVDLSYAVKRLVHGVFARPEGQLVKGLLWRLVKCCGLFRR